MFEMEGSSSGLQSGTSNEGSSSTGSAVFNQLVTHLPDEVVYLDHKKKLPHQKTFQGVLMFLDISGFTALSERYSTSGKHGTDQLTKTLSGYMGALVSEVLSFDGDILKFAGDAILTLWKVESFLEMKSTVLHVIRCGMSIQEKYGEWVTNVGIKLHVKIGIAAGEVSITFVGNEDFCHYVTLGRAVAAVNVAESFCKSGDVVVSPTAWCHISCLDLERLVLHDQKHMKILDDLSRFSSSDYIIVHTLSVSEAFAVMMDRLQEYNTSNARCLQKHSSVMNYLQGAGEGSRSGKKVNKPTSENAVALSTPEVTSRNVDVVASKVAQDTVMTSKNKDTQRLQRVRNAVIDKFDLFTNQTLRLYIAAPVIRKLDDQQPLEYLSEMRQVTIVFINLVLKETTKTQRCILLQKAFQTIQSNVKKRQGCLNKMFMFDKGCTFLAVFGLPGFKHERDCAHALQSAKQMHTELDEFPLIIRTSIGVTTGSTFCGVVGHSHRQEYTVIGRKVNMAARLMMYYPGKVTCDNDTFHHSKLHKSQFGVLEMKELKGLQNVGIIREFKEQESDDSAVETLKTQEYEYPLLGREYEVNLFMRELHGIKNNPNIASQRQLIVFEGEAGIGKTRLLDAVLNKAVEQNIRVISTVLSMHDSKTPYFVVKSLLMDLLQFDYDLKHHEREQALYKMFKNSFIIENLCMLNDLLQLKLPENERYLEFDSKQKAQIFHDLLFRIVQEMCAKVGLVIFAVDDAHFMDQKSWEFVEDLGHDMNSLVVMTIRTSTSTPWCDTAENVMQHSSTITIKLEGLQPQFLPSLACQILDVQEIPQKLESILEEKSHGVPSWCEQLLKEMFFDGTILVIPEKDRAKYIQAQEEEAAIAPDPKLMQQRKSIPGGDLDMLPSFLVEFDGEDSADRMICIMSPDKDIAVGIPDSIKGMVQARIDRMEESDQMVIKCASILGLSFPRIMLDAVVPVKQVGKTDEIILRLMKNGIFECGFIKTQTHQQHGVVKGAVPKADCGQQRHNKVLCCCDQGNGRKDSSEIRCKFLRFKAASFQETAYEIFVESSRCSLHRKAAKFLESYPHLCRVCGGRGFMPGLEPRSLVDKKTEAQTQDVEQEKESRRLSIPSSSSSNCGPATCWLNLRRNSRRFKTTSDASTPVTALPDTYALEAGLKALDYQHVSVNSPQNRRPSTVLHAIRDSLSTQKNSSAPRSRRSTIISIQNSVPEEVESKVDELLQSSEIIPSVVGSLSDVGSRLECKCMLVLASVYPQLVRHWRAAGNVERTVHFLMEAGAAAIAVYDNTQGLSYLREVSRIIEAVKAEENPFEGELQNVEEYFFDNWEEARLESLIGQALFHMNQKEESVPHFNKSVTILGNRQPHTKFGVMKRMVKEAFIQWRHCKYPNKYMGKSNPLLSHRLIEQSRCLAHLFYDYMGSHEDKKALMTTLQEMNLAELANTNLHEVIVAYTNMMECCIARNWQDLGKRYEFKAQLRCTTAMNSAHADDLITIAHLYVSSLNMRLVWGRIPEAIDCGSIAERISSKLHNNDFRRGMLPTFAQALLLSSRIMQCVEILQELKSMERATECKITTTWYYNCCLDFLLESGFQLEPFQICLQFAKDAKDDHVFQSDHLPLYYLANCLALWFARHEDLRAMEKWLKVAEDHIPIRRHTYMAMHGHVKHLEAKLLLLSRSHRREDIATMRRITGVIRHALKQLEHSCKTTPVFQPRCLHLEAYMHAINGAKKKANACLNKSINLSTKTGNMLELHWATHSQQVWYDPDYEKTQADHWREHSSTHFMDYHKAGEIEGSVVKFSLPLPSW